MTILDDIKSASRKAWEHFDENRESVAAAAVTIVTLAVGAASVSDKLASAKSKRAYARMHGKKK